jgi:hypothetical protein
MNSVTTLMTSHNAEGGNERRSREAWATLYYHPQRARHERKIEQQEYCSGCGEALANRHSDPDLCTHTWDPEVFILFLQRAVPPPPPPPPHTHTHIHTNAQTHTHTFLHTRTHTHIHTPNYGACISYVHSLTIATRYAMALSLVVVGARLGNAALSTRASWCGTVLVFEQNLHSSMSLVPTPARLTRGCVRPLAFLSGFHFLTD